MNSLINASEVDQLLKKTTPYTQSELMKLSSFSISSLVNQLSDLSYSEKEKVLRLEGENLYRYMTSCRVAIGADKRGFAMINALYSSTIQELKSAIEEEASSESSANIGYCVMLVRFILTNAQGFDVKFNGDLPKKIFSFRQQTANEWYKNLLNIYTRIAAQVAFLNGVDEASEFILMQCAWHMHHILPNKYKINEVDKLALLDLASQFLDEFN